MEFTTPINDVYIIIDDDGIRYNFYGNQLLCFVHFFV